MQNAKVIFHKNIQQANELGKLYALLMSSVPIHQQLDDLLRSQIVNVVSAFDKLMHDLIRIGMVQIFEGQRAMTDKYASEVVAIKHLPFLSVGSVAPPAVYFEELVREKLSIISFQDPKKVADGLSYIWSDNQKWYKIAQGLGFSDEDVRVRLKLIVSRRNAIVHEADLDPVNNFKLSITLEEAVEISDFLLKLGDRIYDLVV